MNSVTLTFAANGQQLVRTGCEKFAANTVNYIQAKFDLGEGWDGFDSVRAVWQTDFAKIATVLDNDGNCTVPQEVLKRVNSIMVNLVGSISDGTELTDRLTTYKVKALAVNGATNVDGTETTEVTPSQFEQFVAIVRDEVAEVKDIDRVELNPDYTLTIYFSDGTSTTTGSIRGEVGPAGPEGPTGETGNGIESIDLTGSSGNIDTYTISFTDGSTTTFTVTNGEVTMEQLSQVLPTDTASGAVASFPDGQTLIPLQSLTVNLDPIQDLNGYDAPWVGGAGKNKLPYVVGGTSGNATAVVSSDGSVTLNGTGFAAFYTDYFTLPAGTYILNGNTDYPNTVIYLDGVSGSSDINTGATITFSEETTMRGVVQIYPDKTVSNLTLKPMLRKSAESSTYAPYENICPISGHTEVVTQRTGKNLLPNEKYPVRNLNVIIGQADGTYRTYLKAGTYTISAKANAQIGIFYRKSDGESNVRITQTSDMPIGTFTVTDDGYYRIWAYNSNGVDANDIEWFQLELGSTATSYEPYDGDTYTTQLGQTVYGGTLDLVSGVLTVDRAMVDLGTLNWSYITSATVPHFACYPTGISTGVLGTDVLTCSAYDAIACINASVATSIQFPNGSICQSVGGASVRARNDDYTDATTFKTAMDGVQLVYELATPQTYQLTPQQINTLLGDNNVWSEQGSVAVVYKADIQLWVEKKLA